MRPRFLIFVSIAVLAILAVVLWLRPVQRPVNLEPAPMVQATDSVSVTPATPPTTASIASPNVPGNPSLAALPPANPSPTTGDAGRKVRVIQEYNEQHNAPIEFYGQVIDQDSNALSGVKINVSIQQASAVVSPTNDVVINGNVVRSEKETGADGRFEITGEQGDGVGIDAIQKDGYETEPNMQRNFGASSGSYDNPVVFKMWSTNIHEQLLTGEKKFVIVPDGRPYVIDLAKGTIAESGAGDLKIWVKRPDPITAKRCDWSCEVDAVSGGLLQETDSSSSMYSAPADGYVPSFQFEQKVGSGWGDTTGPQRFYVRLNNGQEYGRITIELYAYYNNQTPGLIRLQYAINPSSSRILR